MSSKTYKNTQQESSGKNDILDLKNLSFNREILYRLLSLEKQVKELQDQFRALNIIEK